MEVNRDDEVWKGKKAAVSLTYDDALNVHLDNAIPLLDSLNLNATFYLSGFFPGYRDRIADWKRAAESGYELGNHTLFHPCNGGPGRDWVKPNYDLTKYDVDRIVDESRMNNILLESLDGKKERTFAYTCGHMTVDGQNFMDEMHDDFLAARAVRSEMHTLGEVDLYNVDSYMVNGETGEELINLVKKAMSENKLLVFLFHGVGGEHSLNVDLKAHRTLLNFLKDNEEEVWTASMIDVAKHVKHINSMQ